MSERKLPTIYTCFPGGKHKVLTMSYDDGKLEDRRLISIFNKYGIKGTFHLNSGLEMDTRIPTSEYQELYKGHEVSCHTLTLFVFKSSSCFVSSPNVCVNEGKFNSALFTSTRTGLAG